MEAQIINTQNPAVILDLQPTGNLGFSGGPPDEKLHIHTDNNVGMACVNPSATLCVAGENETLKIETED